MDKTILFIDDKPSIGKILKTYLEEDGNHLIYFENAPSAIEWLDQGNRPALIITDMRMPLMPGDEFLAFLKSLFSKAIPCTSPFPWLSFRVRKARKNVSTLLKPVRTTTS